MRDEPEEGTMANQWVRVAVWWMVVVVAGSLAHGQMSTPERFVRFSAT